MEFDEETRERIARAVRDRRAELGLSQEQAARSSGGMISTANLRVVEGAGRASFRPKSLIGVARALSWPTDAVTRLAAGEDPATFPTVGGPTPAAPDPRPSAGGTELATAAQVADLRREVADQRAAIDQLSRAISELIALIAGVDRVPGFLAAAHSGSSTDITPEGPRRATLPRVGPVDPDAVDAPASD